MAKSMGADYSGLVCLISGWDWCQARLRLRLRLRLTVRGDCQGKAQG